VITRAGGLLVALIGVPLVVVGPQLIAEAWHAGRALEVLLGGAYTFAGVLAIGVGGSMLWTGDR
jgi:hypothetical protein